VWRPLDSSAAFQVAAMVDHSSLEAVCTALLIRELLKGHFPLLDLVPHILGQEEVLTARTKVLLVVCSNGCFQQRPFVDQLFQAASVRAGVITVVAEQSFRFPTEAFYSEMRQAHHVLSDRRQTTDDLVSMIRRIFEEIAIVVHPQDSDGAVKVRVAAIAQRLSLNSVKSLTPSNAKDTIQIDEECGSVVHSGE